LKLFHVATKTSHIQNKKVILQKTGALSANSLWLFSLLIASLVVPLTDSKAPTQHSCLVGEPPLSVADTYIIFRNISELAVLSDMLAGCVRDID
jgi:hypothetical protein